MKAESWKDIPGYEGLYQVSDHGNVRSLGIIKNCYDINHERKTIFIPKITNRKLLDNGSGYLYVSLKKNGKRKNHYVHRLVAESYCEKKSENNHVNHIDYNKKNNHADNLEWCTPRENVEHSKCHMRKTHISITNTGEKYITKKKDRNLYRVSIKNRGIEKCFKTIPEAVEYRDKVLNGIDYSN